MKTQELNQTPTPEIFEKSLLQLLLGCEITFNPYHSASICLCKNGKTLFEIDKGENVCWYDLALVWVPLQKEFPALTDDALHKLLSPAVKKYFRVKYVTENLLS